MMMMYTLTLVLFVGSLVASAAFGQNVEIRGTNGEKVNGEGRGQARAIYSPRHQKMHFGKRPETLPAPKIPFMINIDLPGGQTLESVPEEGADFSGLQFVDNFVQPNNLHNLQYKVLERQEQQLRSMYPYDNPISRWFVPLTKQQMANNKQVARQQPEQKLLRLISGTNVAEDNGDSSNSAEQAINSSNQTNEQQEDIKLTTRSSMQQRSSNKQNGLLLPDQIYSHLYYTRNQNPVAVPNFGSYNKKAEPKDNFFMHFG